MDETIDVDVFEDNGVLMLRYPDGSAEAYDDYMRRTDPGMSYDNATGELIVATPVSAEAGMMLGGEAAPDTFGDTTARMVSPYFEAAADLASTAGRRPTYFENPLMQGLERTGQYIGDMTLAGLSAGLGTVYGGAGLLGEAFGGDTQDERRLARDLAAMFDAAGPAPEGRMGAALLELGAGRAAAADVAERLNQPGPMPVMGSNFGNLLGESVIGGMRKKVDKVSDMVRSAYGVTPSVSYHPTKFGNSAYLTAKIPGPEKTYATVGFRLSDHDVGEFRRSTDALQTIIDEESITPEELFSSVEAQYSRSLPSLQALQIDIETRKALSETYLQMWGGLSNIQKENVAKSYDQHILRPGRFNRPWRYLSNQEKGEYAFLIGQQPPQQGLLSKEVK